MATSRVVLPVLNLEQNDETLHKVVLKGAKHFTTQLVHNDNQSANQIQFTITPPSQNTVIDRRIDLVYETTVSIAAGGTQRFVFPEKCGTDAILNTDANIGIPESYVAGVRSGNGIALRQMPISSIVQNLNVELNGTNISNAPRDYVHAVMQYTDPEWRKHALKGIAHAPDNFNGLYNAYYDSAGGATAASEKKRSGLPNALSVGDYRCGEEGRGAVLQLFNINGALSDDNFKADGAANASVPASDTTTFVLRIREPLFLSPFTMAYGEGMTNINQIKVEVTFDASKLQKIFSKIDTIVHAKNVTSPLSQLTGLTQTFVPNSAKLAVRYYTPQDDIRIPNEIVLPYHQVLRHTGPVRVLAANVAQTDINSNRRLNQIPEALYLWVARPQTDAVYSDANGGQTLSDGFAAIENINIQFQNQVGILSNLDINDLFALAKDNGCDVQDLNEYRSRGACIKLMFGKDIPLPNNEAPGTRGDYDIQIQVTYRQNCLSGQAALNNLEVNELYVYNGHVIISPNECRVQTGLLDLKDNIEASDMGDHYHGSDSYTGGGLFSSLKKMAGKVGHYVKKGKAAYDKGKALYDQHSDTINKGISMAKGMMGNQGGSVTGGSVVGGSMVGGYMSRRR